MPSRSASSRRGTVFTTATLIGYVLGGVPGGAVRHLWGYLCPHSFLSRSAGRCVPRIQAPPVAGTFLDGVNARRSSR